MKMIKIAKIISDNKREITIFVIFIILIFTWYSIIFKSHFIPPLRTTSYKLLDLRPIEIDSNNEIRYEIINGKITIDTIGVLVVGQPATFTAKDFEVVFYSMENYGIENISSIKDVILNIRFMKNISESRWRFFGPKIEIPLNKNFEQVSPISKKFTFTNQGNYDIIFSIEGNSTDRVNNPHFHSHFHSETNEFFVNPSYIYYNLETNAYLLWFTSILVTVAAIEIFAKKRN